VLCAGHCSGAWYPKKPLTTASKNEPPSMATYLFTPWMGLNETSSLNGVRCCLKLWHFVRLTERPFKPKKMYQPANQNNNKKERKDEQHQHQHHQQQQQQKESSKDEMRCTTSDWSRSSSKIHS
jgi:Mg-chelatase subunit ChlI